MSPPKDTISDIEMQAYIDNELDSTRRAEVEQMISSCTNLQAEVEEFRQINSGLEALFQPQLEKKVPKHIHKAIAPNNRANYFAQAASFLLAITIGIVSGWYANSSLKPPLNNKPTAEVMVKDAFAFHAIYTPEKNHPVEVDASRYTHLVTWLSKRLETDVRIPDLEADGFKLLGGRLLTSEDRPAAQFMYENNDGQRITVFARNCGDDDAETAFSYASKNDINGFYWTDKNLSFVILADIEKSKMADIAHTVYEQMNR